MTPWNEAEAILSSLNHRTRQDMGPTLKTLPSQVRRMGLVRTLEALRCGTLAQSGTQFFQSVAPALQLPPQIPTAVNTLETCPRPELFGYHRRAVQLFDRLATLHRVESSK